MLQRRPSVSRASVSWAVDPQDGDAAEACAEIETWRARRPPAPDWEATLGALRDALATLCAAPLLRGDAEALALLRSLAEAPDPEALDAVLDRLRARTDALAAGRGASPESVAPRIVRLDDLLPQAGLQPGGRTIFRL